MIKSKKELNSILNEDLSRFEGKTPSMKDKILHNEVYYIWSYIYHMRYIEYHQNKGGLHKLLYLWHFYKLKRLQFKLHFAIYPNTVGSGFRIYHVGNYVHIGPKVKIGKNCTIVSGVVFGKKTENDDVSTVVVGNNCYFGLDCKILGSVHIGNNVIIGANAIVTKDIPDDVTVLGVNRVVRNNE